MEDVRPRSTEAVVEVTKSPEQSLTEPTLPQKTDRKWLLPGLIGLVVMALGIAGYFAYQNFQLKRGQSITTTTTPAPASGLLTSTPIPTTNLKKYTDKNYGFSFAYPQEWEVKTPPDSGLSLSIIANGHEISVRVWQVTGFGYCYKYGERKEIIVGGKNAETADGIGPSEMCDKPEEFSNRGNTFVLIPLIPLEDKPKGLPTNQIHISYDYPLSDISLAKSNLNQVLSTFKFLDQASETANWETYENELFSFSLKYPPTITLLTSENQGPWINVPTNQESVINLLITIESFDSINTGQSGEQATSYNLGYDSETALIDLQSLQKNNFGSDVDFVHVLPGPEFDSRKVINLGKVNAKTFMVLGRFETCDITFERKAIFYPDNTTRAIITLLGPKEKIILENPAYFESDRWKNCMNLSTNYGKDMFYKDVIVNKTGPTTNDWYKTFDQILSTIKFTN